MTRIHLLAATFLASLAFAGAAGAQPVTGLYIAGGGGANFKQGEEITNRFLGRADVGFDNGYVALGSIGWGFGNGLRVEVEGNYRQNRFDTGNGTASSSAGGKEKLYGGMVNALFDLDVGSPFVYPYFGGGAGYANVEQRARVTLVSPGSSLVTTANLNQGSFAYQAIAGASFPIPGVVGLSLTAEYRFFALGGERSGTATAVGTGSLAGVTTTSFKEKSDYNHSLLLGLRYAFNVAPPPAPAAPAPAPVTAARTYLVFFDWDRADLTDRARQIVAEAAAASQRIAVTRIEVSGNTDTSGTARYNQGLSQRRAQAVAAELIRLGVPRSAIVTHAYGQTRLLVPTGPGVREPQNRRVEIVLQ